MHGHEPALRLHQIVRGRPGPVERKLEDFDPGALLQTFCTEDFTAEDDRLAFE
jgi:hypothetical protein